MHNLSGHFFCQGCSQAGLYPGVVFMQCAEPATFLVAYNSEKCKRKKKGGGGVAAYAMRNKNFPTVPLPLSASLFFCLLSLSLSLSLSLPAPTPLTLSLSLSLSLSLPLSPPPPLSLSTRHPSFTSSSIHGSQRTFPRELLRLNGRNSKFSGSLSLVCSTLARGSVHALTSIYTTR